MRQRLGVARALLNEPSVVLLDEPTLGLDPAGQRQVLDLVGDISARTGATVVLSTHALPDVREVCTRALVMEEGRAVAAGTVAEVSAQLTDPARPARGPSDEDGRGPGAGLRRGSARRGELAGGGRAGGPRPVVRWPGPDGADRFQRADERADLPHRLQPGAELPSSSARRSAWPPRSRSPSGCS